MVEEIYKRCAGCEIQKPATLEFWYKENRRDGLGYYCKLCVCEISKRWKSNNREKYLAGHREYNKTHSRTHEKKSRSDWRRNLLYRAKNRSREMKLPCNLDLAFIDTRMSLQGGRCYYTGTLLDTTSKRRNPLGPSLDRINSSLGYTKDNVVISCLWANLAKSDTDAEEFQTLLRRMELENRPTI